jgi:hypothetical protein
MAELNDVRRGNADKMAVVRMAQAAGEGAATA